MNSARHDREPARRALHRHAGALARGVRSGSTDVRRIRTALASDDRLLRNDERVSLIVEMQRRRRELPRPHASRRVVEGRLELHRARGGVDRVIDERKFAHHRLADHRALLDRSGTRVLAHRTVRASHRDVHRDDLPPAAAPPACCAIGSAGCDIAGGGERDRSTASPEQRHSEPRPPAGHPGRRTGARAEAAPTESRSGRESARTWLITTSGVWPAERTILPRRTSKPPVFPPIGARMIVLSRLKRACDTAARSARRVASAVASAVMLTSPSCGVITFEASSATWSARRWPVRSPT